MNMPIITFTDRTPTKKQTKKVYKGVSKKSHRELIFVIKKRSPAGWISDRILKCIYFFFLWQSHDFHDKFHCITKASVSGRASPIPLESGPIQSVIGESRSQWKDTIQWSSEREMRPSMKRDSFTSAFTAISHKAHARWIECNINFKVKAQFYLLHWWTLFVYLDLLVQILMGEWCG